MSGAIDLNSRIGYNEIKFINSFNSTFRTRFHFQWSVKLDGDEDDSVRGISSLFSGDEDEKLTGDQ